MSRCVIIGGAEIGNYGAVRAYLNADDFNVVCDCGLRHLDKLGIRPHLIVGDFDSHPNPNKDDTDTVYGVKEALARGYEEFLLIGVIGDRLDHTLGNVSLLLMLDTQGKTAKIVNNHSEMEIISSRTARVENRFAYFSLLNISGTASGITIQNAKYPLENAEITCEYQYGISNEVLPGSTAEISVKNGRLLLVKVLE